MVSFSENLKHDAIVCIHNGHRDVELCLDSLINSWDEKKLNKLILINDASDNDMTEYLDSVASNHAFIKHIHLSNQHYYTRAANVGLKNSDGDICTLLNSDTIVTKSWAKKIQDVFALDPAIGIVGPLSNAASTQSVPFVKGSSNQTAINSLPTDVSIEEYGKFIEEFSKGIVVPFVPLVHGFCFSISRSVINEVGLLDEESFPRGYGEETDFCFRTEDAGFILAIAVDTFIYHSKSKSYNSNERIKYMNDGMQMLVQKYGEDRIKSSITFMEDNKYLNQIRNKVLNKWKQYFC